MTVTEVSLGLTTAETASKACFLTPLADFLCLGGLSLALLAAAFFIPPSGRPVLLACVLLLSYFVNYPHFMHSYQIFYRGFAQKALGAELKPGLRRRYIFAGIAVPLGMMAFFIIALRQPDTRYLAYGAGIMTFLSGWHYVKQGYGVLIVDSVFKKRFFSDGEKKMLRANAYACWIFSWLCFNLLLAKKLLPAGIAPGLSYYAFPIPAVLLYPAGLAALATSAATAAMLIRKRFFARLQVPAHGLMAYAVTVYVWMFGSLNPMLILMVPFFHSLQYLAVVWRYEFNRSAGAERTALSRCGRLCVFIAFGILLGYLGFWQVPVLLDKLDFRPEVFGAAIFLGVFALFINTHHYFLDNVIWRSDNPETRACLFGLPKNQAAK